MGATSDDLARTRSIAFNNWAHALDHYVLLIFPTVVLGLEAVYQRPYAELIALSTASFVAFGVFSLPAGWLADRWSRRNMMVLFYLGCGLSLLAAAWAPNLAVLALALFALGVFAAIYHPVGTAILVAVTQTRSRTLAFNGVCGNLGVALAAGISAVIATWLGWRAAFLIPAVVCIVTGLAYLALIPHDGHRVGSRQAVAEVALSPKAAALMLALYVVISLASGLTFNTMTVALPKIVDERLGQAAPLIAVGGIATIVFLCGALAQLTMGRLLERIAAHVLFVVVASLQFLGLLWAANTSGAPLIVALGLTMAAIYGQVTIGDVAIARYTADAWRGRVYAVRFFLTFVTSGAAVAGIAMLHGRGGSDLVLVVTAAIAAVLLAGVLGFSALAASVESKRAAAQPAE
jgi:MFS family permease